MLQSAAKKHREAWESLVASAAHGEYARHAIYASRSLAVAHPEVYLLGDSWFYQGASKLTGFQECYEDPTSLGWCHMEYGRPFFRGGKDYPGIPGGQGLNFGDIKLAEYRPVSARRLHPAPFEAFIDHRLAPLAVSLKTEGRAVSPLELAEIVYFQRLARGSDPRHLFLVQGVDGGGYLFDGEHLVSMKTGDTVERPTAGAALIFNSQAVWYPVMGRDDSGANPELRRAVDRLASPDDSLELTPWEEGLLGSLRAATALDNDDQRTMAAIAATRATGWKCHPFYAAWSRSVPEDDFEITISRRLCIVREFDRLANSVSPATAYLYGVLSEGGSLEERMRRLSREYLIRTGVVREAEAHGWKPAWRLESWGHLWPCGLMEHTVDDAFRSRTGHCVSQCHMIGAVLEMAKIPHVVVNFDRGGVKEGISHHFVLSQDGTFLFDDGIVNFRGVDADTEDYGPLLSFAIGGEWARTVASGTHGNVTTARLGELLQVVDRALAGRFPLQFYADRQTKEILSKDQYLQRVAGDAIEEVTLP